jgi:hypothetical protein
LANKPNINERPIRMRPYIFAKLAMERSVGFSAIAVNKDAKMPFESIEYP